MRVVYRLVSSSTKKFQSLTCQVVSDRLHISIQAYKHLSAKPDRFPLPVGALTTAGIARVNG